MKKKKKKKDFVEIRHIIDDIVNYIDDIDMSENDNYWDTSINMCFYVFKHMQLFAPKRQIILKYKKCEYYGIGDKMIACLSCVKAYVMALLQAEMITLREHDFYLAGINELEIFVRSSELDFLPFE